MKFFKIVLKVFKIAFYAWLLVVFGGLAVGYISSMLDVPIILLWLLIAALYAVVWIWSRSVVARMYIDFVDKWLTKQQIIPFTSISESTDDYWEDYPIWYSWFDFLYDPFVEKYRKKKMESFPVFTEKKIDGYLVVSPKKFFIYFFNEGELENKICLIGYKYTRYCDGCWHYFYNYDGSGRKNKEILVCFDTKKNVCDIENRIFIYEFANAERKCKVTMLHVDKRVYEKIIKYDQKEEKREQEEIAKRLEKKQKKKD